MMMSTIVMMTVVVKMMTMTITMVMEMERTDVTSLVHHQIMRSQRMNSMTVNVIFQLISLM